MAHNTVRMLFASSCLLSLFLNNACDVNGRIERAIAQDRQHSILESLAANDRAAAADRDDLSEKIDRLSEPGVASRGPRDSEVSQLRDLMIASMLDQPQQSVVVGGAAQPQYSDEADYAETYEPPLVAAKWINTSEELLKVFALYPDAYTGAIVEDLYAVAEAGETASLDMYAGNVWRIKRGDETVGEYFTLEILEQTLTFAAIEDAWKNQPTEEDSEGLIRPITYLDARIDPEGNWISEDDDFREHFNVALRDDGGVLVERSNGELWSFRPTGTAPDTYIYDSSFDEIDRTTFVGKYAEEVALAFDSAQNARLRVGESFIQMSRDDTASIPRTLALSLINDPEWDAWIGTDQGDASTMPRYTSADWANMPIAEGFAGELIGSKLASYRGFNALLMDPLTLGSNPGVDGRSLIFELTDDKTLEWTTAGTAYRVPWSYFLQPEIGGSAETQTSLFFSESQSQDSWGVDVTLPQGISVGHKETSDTLESKNEVSIRAQKWSSEYWLILNKRYARLSDTFVASVRALPELPPEPAAGASRTAYDNAYYHYAGLFETFGTHYPLSVLYGGRAYLEEKYTASEVANSFSSQTGVKYEREATLSAGGSKGSVSVPIKTSVGFETAESNSSKQKNEDGRRVFWFSGGEGPTFDMWQISQNKLLQPIRVDLRPVHEVVLPKLFRAVDPDDFEFVKKRGDDIERALCRYLKGPDATRLGGLSTRPIAIGVSVSSIMLTIEDDEGAANSIEAYGTVNLLAAKDGVAFQSTVAKTVWSVSEANDKSWPLNTSLPGLSTEEIVFHIPPESVTFANGQWSVDFDLNRYTVMAAVSITEDDNTSDDPSSTTLMYNLGELGAGDAFPTKKVYYGKRDEDEIPDSAPTFDDGEYTITLRVRQIGFPIHQNLAVPVPDFPNYRDPDAPLPTWCE